MDLDCRNSHLILWVRCHTITNLNITLQSQEDSQYAMHVSCVACIVMFLSKYQFVLVFKHRANLFNWRISGVLSTIQIMHIFYLAAVVCWVFWALPLRLGIQLASSRVWRPDASARIDRWHRPSPCRYCRSGRLLTRRWSGILMNSHTDKN